MKDTLAAFAEKIADQEKRHIAEMEANKKETDFRRMCIDALSKHKGFQAPIFPEGTSNVEAPGGSRGNQEGGEEPSSGNSVIAKRGFNSSNAVVDKMR